MPNNIANKVFNFKGKKEDIIKFKEAVYTDKDLLFDFNKIIPMPEELLIDERSSAVTAMEYLVDKLSKLPTYPSVPFHIGSDKNLMDEEIDLALKYIKNTVKYGARNWYGWRNQNWGTKWNAFDQEMKDANDITLEYYFRTAWAFPLPIFEKLTLMFPTLSFTVRWADIDDEGYNSGIFIATEGNYEAKFFEGESALENLNIVEY